MAHKAALWGLPQQWCLRIVTCAKCSHDSAPLHLPHVGGRRALALRVPTHLCGRGSGRGGQRAHRGQHRLQGQLPRCALGVVCQGQQQPCAAVACTEASISAPAAAPLLLAPPPTSPTPLPPPVQCDPTAVCRRHGQWTPAMPCPPRWPQDSPSEREGCGGGVAACLPSLHAWLALLPAHQLYPLFPACRSLPRLGVCFGVPPGLQRVQWYGRGPHECYAGARLEPAGCMQLLGCALIQPDVQQRADCRPLACLPGTQWLRPAVPALRRPQGGGAAALPRC